jgi:amino acid transporter
MAPAFSASSCSRLSTGEVTGLPVASTRGIFEALAGYGAWASLLALSGAFEQLTTYTVFGLWIFHGVTASSVFVLRCKYPAMERPYKAFGYPMVPLAFVTLAILLVSNTLRTNLLEAGAGLALIVLGVPVFCYFRFGNRVSVRFRPS